MKKANDGEEKGSVHLSRSYHREARSTEGADEGASSRTEVLKTAVETIAIPDAYFPYMNEKEL